MKQSEKLDLILKGLYEYKYDRKFYSIGHILESYGTQTTPDEIYSLGKKLENDGYIKFIGRQYGGLGCLTIDGIMYVEGDSYTYNGNSIVTNHYNFSIVNSPNSNLINQSKDVSITQNLNDVLDAIKSIRDIVQKDNTLDPVLIEEILECLEEINQNIENGNKPKFAIKSLLDLAGSISSISSWVLTIGQYAGLVPPLA